MGERGRAARRATTTDDQRPPGRRRRRTAMATEAAGQEITAPSGGGELNMLDMVEEFSKRGNQIFVTLRQGKAYPPLCCDVRAQYEETLLDLNLHTGFSLTGYDLTVSPHYWPPVTKTKEGLKMVAKSTYPNEMPKQVITEGFVN